MAAAADGPPLPQRLRKRAEFLACAKGRRFTTAAFVLQECRREAADSPPRFGFTTTKKVGKAHERNRMRRRLREVVRIAAAEARPGHDYVLVARREALDVPFATLTEDLRRALKRLASPPSSPRRPHTSGPARNSGSQA